MQGVGVLVRAGKTMDLKQKPAASGFVYASSAVTVRGKGDELIVEPDNAAPFRCRSK